MRQVALATLLVLSACAGPDASPGPAPSSPDTGWAAARVGDRVDLRFTAKDDDGTTTVEHPPLGLVVEVVKVDATHAWVRLAVRDAQGGPVAHPTVSRDLIVPARRRGASPVERPAEAPDGREPLEVAGRRLDCARTKLNALLVDGGLTRTWTCPGEPDLYLVAGVARTTFRSSGMDGVVATTQVEVTGLRRGEDPAATGALPDGALVLFEPGRWYATDGGEAEGVGLHRFLDDAGRVLYAETDLDAAPGSQHPAPSPAEVTEQRTLLDLLRHRAVAVARQDEEWDPVVRWRQQPLLAEGACR